MDKVFKIKKKTRWQKFQMVDIIEDYTKNVPPIFMDALWTYTTQRKHALSD